MDFPLLQCIMFGFDCISVSLDSYFELCKSKLQLSKIGFIVLQIYIPFSGFSP